jgi:ribose-phosphate pyrophosphokinase
MKADKTVVFASSAYAELGQRVARLADFAWGEVERQQFPDGERYQRIMTPTDARDVILIGGTISDSETLEIYDLAAGVVKYGAHTLTLVIPYFGYGTMERAVLQGEIVTAKTRARLLSSIPEAGSGNQVVLLDLHSPGIAYYFEGGIRTYHVYAKPLILEAAQRLGGDRYVLACTDAGRAKWVESLANDLGVDASFVFKRRLDGRRTEVAGMSAHVENKRVIIYDDLIRTGGSLLQAARAYREAGAASIAAIATHGLFPEDALARLEQSGLFEELVCTDSHPRAVALQNSFLTVRSIDQLLAAYLREMPSH